MRISVISFTGNGVRLSKKIKDCMQEETVALYTKYRTDGEREALYIAEPLADWTGRCFSEKQAVIFIGACGIAVRASAPHVKDKLSDSPVLVVDEQGSFVIPILSGHIGGANELAVLLAERIGAVPVITTATDIRQKFAVDLFAKKNLLSIKNREGIARVSAKVLAGEKITIAVEKERIQKPFSLSGIFSQIELVEYPPAQDADIVIAEEAQGKALEASSDRKHALVLCPKEYVIGIGCKKGKEYEKIDAYIRRTLKEQQLTVEQIAAIASIDRKKEEPGILEWAQRNRIPFVTYPAEKLEAVNGTFESSAFVKHTVGTGNVCERAAMCACGEEGTIIYRKHAGDGMTLAIAKREWRICFEA